MRALLVRHPAIAEKRHIASSHHACVGRGQATQQYGYTQTVGDAVLANGENVDARFTRSQAHDSPQSATNIPSIDKTKDYGSPSPVAVLAKRGR